MYIGFFKIHNSGRTHVFLKKKSENIVFRLGNGSNKEKTTYLTSDGSGIRKSGFRVSEITQPRYGSTQIEQGNKDFPSFPTSHPQIFSTV